MSDTIRIADVEQQSRLFNGRIIFSISLMLVLAFLLLARLAYLQIVNSEHYSTLSQNNRLKVLPIPPPRGLVFSRNGEVVAENRPSFALVVDVEHVTQLEDQVAALRELLHLNDEQIEAFFEEVRIRGRFDEVTLASNLSAQQVAVYSANGHRFPGARIDARLSRYYPNAELWAHVVGYVGRISEQELGVIDKPQYHGTMHIGKTGIEKTYESILHGSVGYQQVEINAQGRILRVLERTPPTPGHDIYLTIDAQLQQIAFEALNEYRGAIVAIDPLTGGILALVSNPSFDSNLFVNGIGRNSYAQLRDSPDRPLFNRALQGQYPPGSTVKPIVALAGLENGTRTSVDTTWCPGWYRLPGDRRQYRDWLKQGHGHMHVVDAIAQSCDVYFYDLARDLGIQGLYEFAIKFGFNAPTGIDLPGEAGGIFPSPDWKRRERNLPWFPGETLITGIGQGFTLVTPLQLAFSTAVLSRKGYGITPHVAGQIEDPIQQIAVEPQVRERRLVTLQTEDHWVTVLHGMEEVMHGTRGTARRTAAGAAYRYAGKTGTAQLFGLPQDVELDEEEIDERLRDHALFVAFAPLEAPQIAVAVIVENGGSGSGIAAPIARKLFDHYLQDSIYGTAATSPE